MINNSLRSSAPEKPCVYKDSAGTYISRPRRFKQAVNVPISHIVKLDMNKELEKVVHLSRFFRLHRIPQELLRAVMQHTEFTKTVTETITEYYTYTLFLQEYVPN